MGTNGSTGIADATARIRTLSIYPRAIGREQLQQAVQNLSPMSRSVSEGVGVVGYVDPAQTFIPSTEEGRLLFYDISTTQGSSGSAIVDGTTNCLVGKFFPC